MAFVVITHVWQACTWLRPARRSAIVICTWAACPALARCRCTAALIQKVRKEERVKRDIEILENTKKKKNN